MLRAFCASSNQSQLCLLCKRFKTMVLPELENLASPPGAGLVQCQLIYLTYITVHMKLPMSCVSRIPPSWPGSVCARALSMHTLRAESLPC